MQLFIKGKCKSLIFEKVMGKPVRFCNLKITSPLSVKIKLVYRDVDNTIIKAISVAFQKVASFRI